ncbi:uncharacterized protein LOC135145689 [Zophobas morio]|uniref:uncharacterized protein LOC135145689 n=1 Tax=Zophobas morio TaxID=2755281 RepID=UPI0030836383
MKFPWCSQAKYLGIIIDNKISWLSHVDYVVAKVKTATKALYSLLCGKSKLSLRNKRQLYLFLHPTSNDICICCLTYNSTALASAPPVRQNNLLRVLTKAPCLEFASLQTQLKILNNFVTINKEELNFLESFALVEILTRFLNNSEFSYSESHRPNCLLLLAALASTSTRAVEHIRKHADYKTLSGLSLIQSIPLELFKTGKKETLHAHKKSKLERQNLQDLRILLSKLKASDQCMEYILFATRQRLHVYDAVNKKKKSHRYSISDDASFRVPSGSQDSRAMLRETCIRSLALLSTVDENCILIGESDGLQVLLDTLELTPSQYTSEQIAQEKLEVARIVANLSAQGKRASLFIVDKKNLANNF